LHSLILSSQGARIANVHIENRKWNLKFEGSLNGAINTTIMDFCKVFKALKISKSFEIQKCECNELANI
jgi:hypothetical protein